MSPITDPSEEYFKDGLWGWVVNQWKKLTADAAGHLQIDVVSSGLPAGGATAANQTTMITALELIDDLRNALNSIATDELDIVFDGQNADVEVTQTTPADLLTGVHGWDGSAWHKLPLVWGFSSEYRERIEGADVDAGDNGILGSAVPSGEIWVVTSAFAFNNDSGNTRILIQVSGTGISVLVGNLLTPVQHEALVIAGHYVMIHNDRLEAYFYGCTAGDDVYLDILGYKMLIAA